MLSGTWQGTVIMGVWEGQRLFFRFKDAGAYEMQLASLVNYGAWSFDAASAQLTISDDSCPAGQTGQYHLRFYGCMEAVLEIVHDDCASRGSTLNGIDVMQPY
jgi:hypothetical protein